MMANILDQLIEKMMVKPGLRQMMPGWMQKYGQRRVFQAALARTYTAWTAPNWEWVDSLFNEHFLYLMCAKLRLLGKRFKNGYTRKGIIRVFLRAPAAEIVNEVSGKLWQTMK